jgi:hypothetical protein
VAIDLVVEVGASCERQTPMRILRLMADYQCHPLWNVGPEEFGDVDPRDLPISKALANELLAWARAFDATLNQAEPSKSGFGGAEAEATFKQRGRQLAERLRVELGSEFTVEAKL